MYKLQKNKIIITGLSDFNTKHILECGQVFRFKELDKSTYSIISKDKKALVKSYENRVEIETEDVEYFINYFDLNVDYSKIKKALSNFAELDKPLKFGYGIRILKQDLFESIISFIISANNNIKRIQSIIEKICKSVGYQIGDYYAFPTLEQLSTLSEQDFKNFGAGYRSEYLYKTIRLLQKVNLEELKNLSTQELKEFLLTLFGVGPKVADCILLFGCYKQDVFPVDTWIAKVYHDVFGGETNRVKISKQLVDRYGKLSGYAQQYLFYSKRELG